MNTTLRRTHELKSGDRRRPETERQGLAPRPSHDSRVASREFVTHRVRYTGTARPNPIIGAPGSLHAPRHSGASSIRGSNRPKSPRRTVQRPSSVTPLRKNPCVVAACRPPIPPLGCMFSFFLYWFFCAVLPSLLWVVCFLSFSTLFLSFFLYTTLCVARACRHHLSRVHP